ncbi:MAG: type II toxin-antitoxin system HipA family toxin [Akkermansiaceae bacterium]
MKSESLSIIANQQKLGTVTYTDNRLSFHYASSWLQSAESFALSASMPLAESIFSHSLVEAYLWGLLPDNQSILDQYGKQFHVSSRNVFRLLNHVGQDCPGAIQFIAEDREAELLNTNHHDRIDQIDWLDEDQLDKLILSIRDNQSLQRTAADQGQFSLAGAQPKTALYKSPLTGQWGIPSGLTPTTHILKPALGEFDGFAENEHFCLKLAEALGMSVAESEVIHCAGIPVIVVTRYDRFFHEGHCHRVHQEDFCQALGVLPHLKYQSDGGPSINDIAEKIWSISSDAYQDILKLADAIILNYLIVGTDAHAKNYSILSSGKTVTRLAPLYDIASALPYPNIYNPHKVKFAMKIGTSYKLKQIELRHWHTCAKQLRIKPAQLIARIRHLAEEAPQVAALLEQQLHSKGIKHPVIHQISTAIKQRSTQTLKMLSA